MSPAVTGAATTPSTGEGLFRYVHSTPFADLLEALQVSLLVSTYQAGKVVAVRAAQGRVSTLLRSFDQPMGLAADDRRLAVGTRNQIWFLRNAPDLAPQIEPAGRHDACFLPRSCHVTGDIRAHQLAWAGEELWLVNTRFSCLCTLHPDYSFVPRWWPPFVTALAADDRCHLNGLALVAGQPRYVTALGETDTPEGWRMHKATGGCLIDIGTGAVVARGLAMPHSPQVYADRLWVLDSGRGRLMTVDPARGRGDVVAELPGYTRGLAFRGRYAFVGLSQIRDTAQFGGLPLAERRQELKCGVWVVDLTTGQTAGFLEFEAGVTELFDIQVLPGIRFPAIVGFHKDAIDGAFIVPRAGVPFPGRSAP
jgi:uncharacterized protein (TIGR03032 family)